VSESGVRALVVGLAVLFVIFAATTACSSSSDGATGTTVLHGAFVATGSMARQEQKPHGDIAARPERC